jgi:hypothetical protein
MKSSVLSPYMLLVPFWVSVSTPPELLELAVLAALVVAAALAVGVELPAALNPANEEKGEKLVELMVIDGLLSGPDVEGLPAGERHPWHRPIRAGRIRESDRCRLLGFPRALAASRFAARAVPVAGCPAGRLEGVASGAAVRGGTPAFASDRDAYAGQGVARGVHSGYRGGDRICSDAVADYELCLNDLAGPAGHDQADVAEARVADASLERRAGRGPVCVDRLDRLVHQPVSCVGQIDRRTVPDDGFGLRSPGG